MPTLLVNCVRKRMKMKVQGIMISTRVRFSKKFNVTPILDYLRSRLTTVLNEVTCIEGIFWVFRLTSTMTIFHGIELVILR